MRDHLASCAACRGEVESIRALVRDVSAPIEPRAGALERVLARLDEEPVAAQRPWGRVLAGVLGTAAVAAAIALGPALGHRHETSAGLTARGGPSERSIARDVGVTVYRHTSRLDPLRPGDEVSAQTAYAVSFRNLGEAGAAHVAVFAQDAAHDVHWIEPTWVDSAEDPESVALPHADREAAPRTSVVLERPAPGALHVFAVVTPGPVHVSEVEQIARGTLDTAVLRARWPEALVDETVVQVVAGAGDAPR